jgi:hypothetical protein
VLSGCAHCLGIESDWGIEGGGGIVERRVSESWRRKGQVFSGSTSHVHAKYTRARHTSPSLLLMEIWRFSAFCRGVH